MVKAGQNFSDGYRAVFVVDTNETELTIPFAN
jgi:hypothetical protein